MSHDCDCDNCMETDSRWAPYRETQRALKEDCPRGKHVADLLRATITRDGKRDTAEWWCKHCRELTDKRGKPLVKYKALEEANKRAKKIVAEAVTAISDRPEVIREMFATCKTHKRYLAKRPPRSNCEDCWRYYIERHPK